MPMLAAFVTVLVGVGVAALPTPSAPITYQSVEVQHGVSLGVAFSEGGGTVKEAVLMLHGFPETSWFWRGVVDPLSREGRVLVMPDMRGYNRSYTPHDILSYNVSHLVNDVHGLVKAVEGKYPQLRQLHVVAHDWGGPIAWLYSHLYPPTSLVILNGPHPNVFEDLLRHDPAQQAKSHYMIDFDKSSYALPPSDLCTADFFGSWFDPTTAKACLAAFTTSSTTWGLAYYRANIFLGHLDVPAFTPDMKTTFPPNVTISCPTQIIWGMADGAFENEKNIEGATRYVGNVTVKRYTGVEHWVAQQVPDRAAADINTFITGIAA